VLQSQEIKNVFCAVTYSCSISINDFLSQLFKTGGQVFRTIALRLSSLEHSLFSSSLTRNCSYEGCRPRCIPRNMVGQHGFWVLIDLRVTKCT